MTKLLGMVGTFVGSWGGWWLGGHVGLTTAVMLGAVGTGAGLFAGRRLADWLIE